jgi:hypothetical protein
MSDVNDWPVVASPSGQKAGDVPFGVPIISRSIGRVVSRIDGPLHINHEKAGAGETRHADTSPNASLPTQYIASKSRVYWARAWPVSAGCEWPLSYFPHASGPFQLIYEIEFKSRNLSCGGYMRFIPAIFPAPRAVPRGNSIWASSVTP